MAKHNSNTIIKFADDTTVVGQNTDNNETNNNLSLNVSKTKELIVDYRKRRAEQDPININGAEVERVESSMLWCPHHQQIIMVQTHQDSREEGTTTPFPVRRLKRFGMGPGCITAWYGNCSASDRKALEGHANGPVHAWGQAS